MEGSAENRPVRTLGFDPGVDLGGVKVSYRDPCPEERARILEAMATVMRPIFERAEKEVASARALGGRDQLRRVAWITMQAQRDMLLARAPFLHMLAGLPPLIPTYILEPAEDEAP